MVVKITYKKPPSSNETQTTPKNTLAKTEKGPQAGPPSAGSIIPFIDRISVVLDVQAGQDAYDIHSNIWAQFNDTEVFKSASKWGKFQVGKRIALGSVLNHKKWPVLHYRYEVPVALQLRLEFSPVDLGPQGLTELHAQLMSLVPDGWGYFVTHGRVTMIEITVDVPHVGVDQFHVVPQQGPSAMAWKANGQMETLVLGKAGSNQTRVYDRGKKRIAAGQKWTGPPTTRVERRLRPQPAFALSALPAMPNPFSSMQLITPQTIPPPEEKKTYIWELFLDSASVRGLPTALKLLPVDKRTTYRKWLLKQPASWWQPETIWSHWPSVLAELKIASYDDWY